MGVFYLKIDKTRLDIFQCRKGWTNRQTAEAAGVHPQFYSRVKNGGTCSHRTVHAIAAALGVDVTEILESED